MTPQHDRRDGVLIVDDDSGFRSVVEELLQAFGYEVVCAENGRVALDLLRRGLRPSIILLDLMMPELNGWEFLALMRQEPELAGIPVAILSGVDSLDAKAATLDACALLKKPLDLDTLLAVVAQTQ
ncbi:response regulator [Sorangium sp. So ce1000]|uniref:response regulator n=1 Tax=Sorangium sp. So ce1000 TaxID=3133325 RepID=UPI003F63FC69